MKWLSDNAVDRLREETDLPDLGVSKYAIVRKLGSGGMGTVYLAQDSALGRKVAVKVMNVSDPAGALAARMMREAQIIALLEHPSIVPIHDVGTLHDGRVFYAMKLVHGERLDQSSAADSLPDSLRLFQKICEAVAFAHSRGVIHRDLKPENIMVGPFGEVLVMDWGVAKVLKQRPIAEHVLTDKFDDSVVDDVDMATTLPLLDGPRGETGKGTVIGTPAYMSPEQARGQTEFVDERSDVYALGAILYFLLTGRPPYESSETSSAIRQIGISTPPRPRHISAKVPKAVEAVCLKAMADRREDRYEGAKELAGDVLSYLDGSPVSAYRENVFEKTGRWLGKNRFLVLLVLAYLLMRILVFLFVGR